MSSTKNRTGEPPNAPSHLGQGRQLQAQAFTGLLRGFVGPFCFNGMPRDRHGEYRTARQKENLRTNLNMQTKSGLDPGPLGDSAGDPKDPPLLQQAQALRSQSKSWGCSLLWQPQLTKDPSLLQRRPAWIQDDASKRAVQPLAVGGREGRARGWGGGGGEP